MIRFCEIKKDCVTRKSAYFAKNFEKNITGIVFKENIICLNQN